MLRVELQGEDAIGDGGLHMVAVDAPIEGEALGESPPPALVDEVGRGLLLRGGAAQDVQAWSKMPADSGNPKRSKALSCSPFIEPKASQTSAPAGPSHFMSSMINPPCG